MQISFSDRINMFPHILGLEAKNVQKAVREKNGFPNRSHRLNPSAQRRTWRQYGILQLGLNTNPLLFHPDTPQPGFVIVLTVLWNTPTLASIWDFEKRSENLTFFKKIWKSDLVELIIKDYIYVQMRLNSFTPLRQELANLQVEPFFLIFRRFLKSK